MFLLMNHHSDEAAFGASWSVLYFCCNDRKPTFSSKLELCNCYGKAAQVSRFRLRLKTNFSVPIDHKNLHNVKLLQSQKI